MKIKYFTFITLLLVVSSLSAETVVNGKLKSIDGKFQHHFKSSGDYWGQRAYDNSPTSSVEGVYEQGKDICQNNKGMSGNVKFYVEEVQCCLEIKKISNKYVVSKIWKEGRGTGYALCSNHVLIRN